MEPAKYVQAIIPRYVKTGYGIPSLGIFANFPNNKKNTNVLANGAVDYDPAENLFSVAWPVPDQLTQARFIVQHNTQPTNQDISGEFNMVGTFLAWAGVSIFFHALAVASITRTLMSIMLAIGVCPPNPFDRLQVIGDCLGARIARCEPFAAHTLHHRHRLA